MDNGGDLHEFLADKTPFHDTETLWGGGTMPLRVRYFVCDELPPERFITSVRCLVLRNHSVLILTNRAGETHALPGGQREAGETLEGTARREVREESGWLIDSMSILGFIHLEHLGPKPSGYRYPYPSFLQVVYCARATQHHPESMLEGDYEEETLFLPIDTVEASGIPEGELGYVLSAATR